MSENEETYSYTGLPQQVRSGPREIDALDASLAALGSQRVMILCGQNVLHKSDVVSRVEKAIGEMAVGRFEGVATHSPVEVVRAARDAAQGMRPDTILSIGGGSAVTIAKGVALLMSTDRDLYDYRIRFEPPATVIPPEHPLPEVTVKVVAVATTMGCAEIGPSGGGYASEERSEKVIVAGDGRTCPRLIVFDGEALATTPASVQKGTTIGQLRVALESVTSTGGNPLGEALGLYAIRMLHRELATGWSQDPQFLLRIKAACALGSHAMVAAGSLGVNTAIAHHVGAVCDAPHGDANAILLPHTIRFNAVEGAKQLRAIAEALSITTDGRSAEGVASAVADEIDRMCVDLGLPRRLRDVGVGRDDLETIAVATLGDRGLRTNPRPVHGRDEVLGILEHAW